ncbi:MAG TPA: hypothetical protein VGE52_13555 [Pirellulales bacterium]
MRLSRFETRFGISSWDQATEAWTWAEASPALTEAAYAAELVRLASVPNELKSGLSDSELAANDVDFCTRVMLLIDGVPLIDLIREVERPFAERDYDARVAGGESAEFLGRRGRLAGNYMYLRPSDAFLPSQNLLGAFYYHDFELKPDDRRYDNSLLLVCSCGNTTCGDLLAKITVGDDVVTWSDFRHSERRWNYDAFGPFVFDRGQYEAQLIAPGE